MASATLMSCGSDDGDDTVSDAAADTTAQSTAPSTTVAPTTSAPATTAVPEATAPPAADEGALDCLVGGWVIDGPTWVANVSAAVGEPVRHVSGRYVYEFADDGTFTVSVEAFTVEIPGEDGLVRVESVGTEEGRWLVSPLSTEEIAILGGVDAADVPDLPHIYVYGTTISVSETGVFDGQRVEFGAVDQDQGIEGTGPVDCSSNTLVIRAISPVGADVPFVRL
ncbi:MAG TPA: hypothetical protein VK866_09840 [Acidimicrobiales bacterium]|nr:hypothetical protein [Acidimicrobiales bacterium]